MSYIKYDPNTYEELPIVVDLDGATLSASNKTRTVTISVNGETVEVPWSAITEFSNMLESITVGGAHIIISGNPYQTAPKIKTVGFDELPDPQGSVLALLEAAPTTYLTDMFWDERKTLEKKIKRLEKKLAKKAEKDKN